MIANEESRCSAAGIFETLYRKSPTIFTRAACATQLSRKGCEPPRPLTRQLQQLAMEAAQRAPVPNAQEGDACGDTHAVEESLCVLGERARRLVEDGEGWGVVEEACKAEALDLPGGEKAGPAEWEGHRTAARG